MVAVEAQRAGSSLAQAAGLGMDVMEYRGL
jgi:hypothetical protein